MDRADGAGLRQIIHSRVRPRSPGLTGDFLERRAGQGPALEFTVGTGRVALPLSARGIRVPVTREVGTHDRQLGRKTDGNVLVTVPSET